LRARLADKDSVIKVLESKVLFLEYDKQVESLSPEHADEENNKDQNRENTEDQESKQRWWARLLHKKHGPSLRK
jgi:hypothetical protein